jgi:predicted acylesterase/phospholipase RssA
MVCGYTPMEIFTIIHGINDVSDVIDVSALQNVIKNWGLVTIQPLINLLTSLVIEKIGVNPTFQQLKDKTNSSLVVTGANVTQQRVEYFSADTTPNVLVMDAVRVSCNLPGIFQKITLNGDNYIDGGAGDNFPIDSVSSGRGDDGSVLGVITTGFSLPSKGSLSTYLPKASVAALEGVIDYIYKIVMFPIMVQTNSKKIGPNVVLVKMNVDEAGLDSVTLPEKKMQLFLKGYNEAKKI